MKAKRIYTVGHSNISTSQFINLLRPFNIEVIVDVRSNPFSKYATQFNKDQIHRFLPANNIRYLYMGDLLGGKPKDPLFYDRKGYVRYDLMAESSLFQEGISRLINGIGLYKVALMCSEENPTACHRRLLIGKVLRERGVEVLHIRKDGTTHKDTSLITTSVQLDLFENSTNLPWRSAQPVSR